MLVGIALRPWLGLLWRSGAVQRCRLRDVLEITARGLQLTPLALRERQLHKRAIDGHRVHPRPVFIIGHFRSGTTHVHSMLAQDPSFGYPTTFQVLFPRVFLSAEELLKPILRRGLPSRRCFDDMRMDVDQPQEEEFALGNVSPFSFYHGMYFARQLRHHIERGVLLGSGRDRQKWQALYRRFLTKVSLKADGRPLLLKNPANSARIPALLAMFPEARFIHVQRNPYAVFLSMKRAVTVFQQTYGFHAMSEADVQTAVLYIYETLMRRMFEDLGRIPRGQLTHVTYESLIGNETSEIARVYDELGLPGSSGLPGRLATHLAAQSDFRPNQHRLDPSVRELVRARWEFAFSKLGYDPGADLREGPGIPVPDAVRPGTSPQPGPTAGLG